MSIVNTETGEILDSASAERRAERIRLRLDTIADNYQAVLPMIREAIEKRDDLALGYRSVGEYVSDRFGGALNNLGIEVRREVVRELTTAGMSTRAIAPVVGVSVGTVHADQVFRSEQLTPVGPPAESASAQVVGINGKTYTRPTPMPSTDRRRPLTDTARDLGFDLRKMSDRLERLCADDRFGRNKDQVAPLLRSHLENAVEVCQDLLGRINQQEEA